MSLEEREQRLQEMEVRAAEVFRARAAELDAREAALVRGEKDLRVRGEELDSHAADQEQRFSGREDKIKTREERIRASEKRLADERAEFEAQKDHTASAAVQRPTTPPDTPKGRTSPEDMQEIRVLEDAIGEQASQFQAQLAKALANQSAEFDAKLQASLAQQAAKFQAQLKESEGRAAASSEEAKRLGVTLSDKADEYKTLEAREAALQAEAARIQAVADETQRALDDLMQYDVVNASDLTGAHQASAQQKKSWGDWRDILSMGKETVSNLRKTVVKAVSPYQAPALAKPTAPAAAAVMVDTTPLTSEQTESLQEALRRDGQSPREVRGPHTATFIRDDASAKKNQNREQS